MTAVAEQDRAVTVKEAAAILGCAEITVKRAIDQDLSSFKIGDGDGRARRIWMSDLRAWSRERMAREQQAKVASIGGAA